MINLTQRNIEELQETAVTAAAYLDLCDGGHAGARLDSDYYRACAALLLNIFGVVDAYRAFPVLMAESPAAREVAEAIAIGRRLETSRLVYYPQLTVVINRLTG